MLRAVVFSIFSFCAACCCGEQPIAVSGQVQLIPAMYPLADYSLNVDKQTAPDFGQWSEKDLRDSYDLMQKVTALWRDSRYADDYLIQGRVGTNQFAWQIVPYPNEQWRLQKYWKLLTVLSRVALGAPHLSASEAQRVASDYRQKMALHYPKFVKDRSGDKRFDAFCNQKILDRQTVYEGRLIRVLYDYSPNGGSKDKLHFLVIPKACRPEFAELTADEYVELQQTTQKMVEYFRNKGYGTIYLFSNNGPNSGQTVPHFHQHFVVVGDESQELWSRLYRLKNYLIPTTPLPLPELQEHVAWHREGLGAYLLTTKENYL